jgi:hypothetical protein
MTFGSSVSHIEAVAASTQRRLFARFGDQLVPFYCQLKLVLDTGSNYLQS